VVCFTGDGDFQMTATELGTALQAGAQPIVLLLNAARIAHPDRRVVCFTGDGDFQMTATELGTALQAGAIEDKNAILPLDSAIQGNLKETTTRVLASLTPR
ncbi:hypothetical protein CNY89_26945, partial [Amaricoccus sp. HAR-UPW-R2A-40]